MAVAEQQLAELSDDQRQLLESWLIEFDLSWDESRLAAAVRQLPPPGDRLRRLALIEMVKVDLERRWAKGEKRNIEAYLQEYPELRSNADSFAEIVQQEYFIRSRHGDQPTAAELGRRFPDIDQSRVLHSDEYMLNTIAFGVDAADTETHDLPAVDRTGTVIFDSKRVSGFVGPSTATGGSSVSSSPTPCPSGSRSF